ncbi:MAG: ABC transporter substrate-binding protein [Aeromicrobium sp.]|nr:ABC transporter substrate-binding protein [Burkholderiales bacterium]
MNRSFIAVAAIFLAVGLASPSIVGAKTIVYGTQDEPQTLDPHSVNLAVTNRLLSNVYEGLVWRDKDFNLVPWLATGWTQPDANTWRFKLRPNVKFHDGSAFTADDVVFSVQRAQHPLSQLKISVQGVERARKVDDLTVDFVMREPNPVLPNHLFGLRIMNRAWAVKNKAETPQNYKDAEDTYSSRNANGTGPFMVKDRQPDVRTVLLAHPDWWNKASPERGNVTEVNLRPIKSSPTRIAALISNEIQFVNDPQPQDVPRMRSSAGVKVTEGQEARVQFLAFDTQRDELLYSSVKGKNPWKDLRVRQAVAYAIDAEAIRTKVMRNMAVLTGTIITSGDQGYLKDADKRLPFDPERAKKLLAEAGYPDGFSVTLDCGDNKPAPDICQAIAPMLARVGIKATPNVMPTGNLFPKLQKFDTSFYLLSWTTPTSDALYTLQSLLRTPLPNATSGDNNYGRYSNKALDELIDRFKVETDLKKRDGIIGEALLLINRELPVVTLHKPIIPWAMRSNISAVLPPNAVPYFFRFNVK